jgi:hypothetical protein
MFRFQDHLQGATLFPEDDLGIETCWSDFKCFHENKCTCVHQLGCLLNDYEMHGATMMIVCFTIDNLIINKLYATK